MSMMPAAPRLRPVAATESPVDRLARLYALRQRLELEIGAVEALLANQEAAVRRLRGTYERPTETDARGRRKVAVCGTDSGYHKHIRRLKEPACQACKIAHAAAEKDRAKRARNA